MSSLQKFLQKHRLWIQSILTVEVALESVLFFIVGAEFSIFWKFLSVGFFIPRWAALISFGVLMFSSIAISGWYFLRKFRKIRDFSLATAAMEIEAQLPFFKQHQQHRSELIASAHFIERQRTSSQSGELIRAHLQFWDEKRPLLTGLLRPRFKFWCVILLAIVGLFSARAIFRYQTHWLPSAVTGWAPGAYESLLPFEGAEWKQESGALAGISGTWVRFHAPRSHFLRYFIYTKTSADHSNWQMTSCSSVCELQLIERGQYAIGTLFSRSPLFPLQVAPDEAPHSVLLAEVNGEFVPSPTLNVLNKDKLNFEVTASDDIQLTKVELYHRFEPALKSDSKIAEEKLQEWKMRGTHYKNDFTLSLKGWKGGRHELYLKAHDSHQSSTSAPVIILFADEETMRAKRLQDLRGVIDDWLHILADLLETNSSHKIADNLIKHLDGVQYPDTDEPGLVTAYIKEMKALGERIENWAKYAYNFSELNHLINRTEKEILYGLSLIFQEKTGEIENTSEDLHSSQNELESLLQQIKEGKLDINSKELDEAFQKLEKKLEELKKKISELPQGPSDDLLNREALQKQADDSESLASRIEAIKKQMASGDSKGAMRELESLLNQLSILSKEMERSLDQWKNNLSSGSIQSSQRFAKKLEEIQKEEEELEQRTSKLKEKSEKLEEEAQKSWKPQDPKKLKALGKDFDALQKDQADVKKEFKDATEAFDKEVQGTEYERLFRSAETKENEQNVVDRMSGAGESLLEHRSFDAQTNEKEAIELLKKAQESQQQIQQQIQSAGKEQESAAQTRESDEKVEIVGNSSKAEKERRRKIMESLHQKVDEKYQKSHEQYFEELLQR